MPIYPPRNEPTRKAEILKKRIKGLVTSINSKSSDTKIAKAAEKVREANLNLIRARIHLLSSYQETDEINESIKLKEKLDAELLKWQNYKLDEILEIYSAHNNM